MSRFRDGTPRKNNTGHNNPASSPEDEIINSILRQREERLQASTPLKGAKENVGQVLCSDATWVGPRYTQSPSPLPTTPEQPVFHIHESQDSPHLSDYSTAAQELDTAVDTRRSLVRPNDHAEYHNSQQNTSLGRVSNTTDRPNLTPQRRDSPTSLRQISQMMAKVRSASSDIDRRAGTPDHSPRIHGQRNIEAMMTDVLSEARDQSINKSIKADVSVSHREVADGYISPPHSRRTSPLNSRQAIFQSPAPMYRYRSEQASPSPQVVQRVVAPLQPMEIPVYTSSTSSPRSRITQTLLEIQQDLANSREGIEAIESRLHVLEQHKSVDADEMRKHVEDCIQNMLDEANESTSPDTDVSTPALLNPESMDHEESDPVQDERSVSASSVDEKPLQNDQNLIKITFKTLAIGCVGVLAVEYLFMSIMNELGRRNKLFVN